MPTSDFPTNQKQGAASLSLATLILMATLASCGQSEPDPFAVDPAAAEARDRIVCRIGDAVAFAPACAIERSMEDRGLVLTIRHPNGGFRRLLVTKDGRGVIAADGAEPARVSTTGPGEIEVAVGGDAYRLPATIRPAR